jgi:hypothetical protein
VPAPMINSMTKESRGPITSLRKRPPTRHTLNNGAVRRALSGPGKEKRTIKAAACPICEFQTTPPHDGRTHRNQKKKSPFSATELKEKGLVKV